MAIQTTEWNSILAKNGSECRMPSGPNPKIQRIAVEGWALPIGFMKPLPPQANGQPAAFVSGHLRERWRQVVNRYVHTKQGWGGSIWIEERILYSVDWEADFGGSDPAFYSPRAIKEVEYSWGGQITNPNPGGGQSITGKLYMFFSQSAAGLTSPSFYNDVDGVVHVGISYRFSGGGSAGTDYSVYSTISSFQHIGFSAVKTEIYALGRTWAELMAAADDWLQLNGPAALNAAKTFYTAWMDGPSGVSKPGGGPGIRDASNSSKEVNVVIGGEFNGIKASFLRYRWKFSACGSTRVYMQWREQDRKVPADLSTPTNPVDMSWLAILEQGDCELGDRLFLPGSNTDTQYDNPYNRSLWFPIKSVPGLVAREMSLGQPGIRHYVSDHAEYPFELFTP